MGCSVHAKLHGPTLLAFRWGKLGVAHFPEKSHYKIAIQSVTALMTADKEVVGLRWNHTTSFGPTFASVLKSQKNQPNVGDLTIPMVIYWNHTSMIWFHNARERLQSFANICQRGSAFLPVFHISRGTFADVGRRRLSVCVMLANLGQLSLTVTQRSPTGVSVC